MVHAVWSSSAFHRFCFSFCRPQCGSRRTWCDFLMSGNAFRFISTSVKTCFRKPAWDIMAECMNCEPGSPKGRSQRSGGPVWQVYTSLLAFHVQWPVARMTYESSEADCMQQPVGTFKENTNMSSRWDYQILRSALLYWGEIWGQPFWISL